MQYIQEGVQKMEGNEQSRKWQLTINNPDKEIIKETDGKVEITKYDYDSIMEKLNQLAGLRYWCMSYEIGLEEKTPHIHLFLYFETMRRFRTIKALFPHPHIERCKGSCQENRDYIFKEGKWQYTDKVHTKMESKQFEGGEMPEEMQGKRADFEELYGMIKSGMTNVQIFEENPTYIKYLEKIEMVRQQYRMEKYKNQWRSLDVTYIWGATEIGKTRSVMDRYGYENVYRVTNYYHPFDSYKGQDIILFEEFRSSLRIQEMLNYLDGYPVELPCRFSDKVACFTKVYILSNWDLKEQYKEVQNTHKETWEAFRRRIHHVEHMGGNKQEEIDFKKIEGDDDCPWKL